MHSPRGTGQGTDSGPKQVLRIKIYMIRGLGFRV